MDVDLSWLVDSKEEVTMKSKVVAREKRARAVELAAQGRSYEEIAREVGFTHRGSAHRAVTKALTEREVAAVDDLRQLELDRLDRLQSSLWPKAMDGDVQAALALLRLTDQRIRLLGLPRRVNEDAGDQRLLVIGPTS